MIKKKYILLAILCTVFSPTVQGQTAWSKNDSVKLKKILDGEADIPVNPTVKQEIDLLFSAPAATGNTPILPVEELLPRPVNLRKIRPMPRFRLNGTRMYYNTPLRTGYSLHNGRLDISATGVYTKKAGMLLQQETDFGFVIAPKFGYHVYAGYSRSESKSNVLPGEVSPLYFGSGFSYDIGRNVQISTGIERQFNLIYKRWEWVWKTGMKVSF